MKTPLLALCFFIAVSGFSQTDTTKTVLYEGTIVKVKTVTELKGNELKVGDMVDFELAEPVMINDKVIVSPGAKATGSVTSAARSKALGKKGKLEFSIDYLYLPNGKSVKLRSTVAANTKGRGATTAAVAVLVSPLGLLWHGQQAKFPQGTVFTAYVDHDTIIN
jgi:pantothenate kinase-related protein Tda10